jgi:hypothetical protein
MCNHEQLLDYLYDELPADARAALEAHLDECDECRAELAALGNTRLALGTWSPPDLALGFTIVRKDVPVPRLGLRSFRPAWGLAAAAVLVLAVAAAISNVEVRYDRDGVIVRTGWGRETAAAPASASVAAGTAVPAAAAAEDWPSRLRALDARLKQVEQSRERRVGAANVDDAADEDPNRAPRMSDAELLRAVRKIIAESETRQQRELALRVTQVIRDFDATRAGDLARVEQGLRQMQGLTDAELIRQSRQLNLLMRVGQER